MYGVAKVVGRMRPDDSDSRLPAKRMPMDLLEHMLNFFNADSHSQVGICMHCHGANKVEHLYKRPHRFSLQACCRRVPRPLIFAQILVHSKRVRVGTGLDNAGIRRFANFKRIYAVFANLCIRTHYSGTLASYNLSRDFRFQPPLFVHFSKMH